MMSSLRLFTSSIIIHGFLASSAFLLQLRRAPGLPRRPCRLPLIGASWCTAAVQALAGCCCLRFDRWCRLALPSSNVSDVKNNVLWACCNTKPIKGAAPVRHPWRRRWCCSDGSCPAKGWPRPSSPHEGPCEVVLIRSPHSALYCNSRCPGAARLVNWWGGSVGVLHAGRCSQRPHEHAGRCSQRPLSRDDGNNKQHGPGSSRVA